jgi:hypothetical protein
VEAASAERAAGSRERSMSPGEPFNPWNKFRGSFIPEAIHRNPDITLAEKSVLARLLRYAGQDGRCHPHMDELALEVGLSERHVRRAVATLEKRGLIRRASSAGGRGNACVFRFIWSSLWNTETRTDSSAFRKRNPDKDGRLSDDKPGHRWPETRTDSSAPYKEVEESHEENQKQQQRSTVCEQHQSASTVAPPDAAAVMPSETKTEEKSAGYTDASVETVYRSLTQAGVATHSKEKDCESILRQAKQYGSEDHPAVVARFIADFCASKKPGSEVQTAKLFIKPESGIMAVNYSPWLAKNAGEVARLTAPPPCPRCDNTGYVGSKRGQQSYPISLHAPQLCDCPAGQKHKHEFQAGTPCAMCDSTLQWRNGTFTKWQCANCRRVDNATSEVAMAAAAQLGARYCPECGYSGTVAIDPHDFESPRTWCNCWRGKAKREELGDEWLERKNRRKAS